ncbi:recombinase family protein [Streptomyces acidicola]|uniref:hypothetical protein n=1 Tax=Streptomyces acidicola TaxID=2596892 RepID=UPI001D153FB4|nr:hypothetical protein [Streptomyces acidicola]
MPDIASTTIANRQPIICSLSCQAAPLARTKIKIGYARVSTGGRSSNDRSTHSPPPGAGCLVPGAWCLKIFADKKSGKNALRPEVKHHTSFLSPISFAGQHDALASEDGGQAQPREGWLRLRTDDTATTRPGGLARRAEDFRLYGTNLEAP